MKSPLPSDSPAAAYLRPADDVLRSLGTDPRRGLAQEEAQGRLDRYGRNALAAERPLPGWRRFLVQFRDALVILLLIATAISLVIWFIDRDSPLPYDAIAIFATIL